MISFSRGPYDEINLGSGTFIPYSDTTTMKLIVSIYHFLTLSTVCTILLISSRARLLVSKRKLLRVELISNLSPLLTKPLGEKMAAAKSLVKQINRTMCCSTARKRVVILGTGWGSYSLLRNIKKRDIDDIDVIVISPRNHFLFTPLLPSTTVG